jgi:hypothetical protein
MAPTASTSSSTDALLEVLAARPGSTTAELAAAAELSRSTAGKLLTTLATQGRVQRQPGGHQGGRRAPDRWTLPAAPARPTRDPHADPSASTAATPDEAGGPDGPPGRLGAGQLRQQVLATLAAQPGQALSPTAIAKTLGRSAGAVAKRPDHPGQSRRRCPDPSQTPPLHQQYHSRRPAAHQHPTRLTVASSRCRRGARPPPAGAQQGNRGS